jgi:methionyl-tRNA synthetase
MSKKYLITSALPYVNNQLHIGHLIGCLLPSDVYARFCRAQGRDVLYIGG